MLQPLISKAQDIKPLLSFLLKQQVKINKKKSYTFLNLSKLSLKLLFIKNLTSFLLTFLQKQMILSQR